jgi:hypothetical protein
MLTTKNFQHCFLMNAGYLRHLVFLTCISQFSIRLGMLSKYYDRIYPPRSSQGTLQHFWFFPKLPLEVQAMIWKEAAANDQPKIVEFFIRKNEGGHRRELNIHHQPPALIRINHESRKWAMKHLYTFLGRKDCLINPSKDVIFMEDAIVPEMCDMWINVEGNSYNPEVEKQVRFLVVGGRDRYPSMSDLEKCGYSNLEKIVLEKQEGELTPRQGEYLDHSWVREKSPDLPSQSWHYVPRGPNRTPEISLLTGDQMNKDVLTLPKN